MLALTPPGASEAKRKPQAPSTPPPLRIVTVTLTPVPYAPSKGPLDLAIEVELPRDLNEATLLEVSSLISSPSKRSMRFLSERQPVKSDPAEPTSVKTGPDSAEAGARPTAIVRLTWDGTDQTKQQVPRGKYSYEIRAKLLAVGEAGPRTSMVSWIKRGIFDVTD
jgi:hypothetical protein